MRTIRVDLHTNILLLFLICSDQIFCENVCDDCLHEETLCFVCFVCLFVCLGPSWAPALLKLFFLRSITFEWMIKRMMCRLAWIVEKLKLKALFRPKYFYVCLEKHCFQMKPACDKSAKTTCMHQTKHYISVLWVSIKQINRNKWTVNTWSCENVNKWLTHLGLTMLISCTISSILRSVSNCKTPFVSFWSPNELFC